MARKRGGSRFFFFESHLKSHRKIKPLQGRGGRGENLMISRRAEAHAYY